MSQSSNKFKPRKRCGCKMCRAGCSAGAKRIGNRKFRKDGKLQARRIGTSLGVIEDFAEAIAHNKIGIGYTD